MNVINPEIKKKKKKKICWKHYRGVFNDIPHSGKLLQYVLHIYILVYRWSYTCLIDGQESFASREFFLDIQYIKPDIRDSI